MPDTVCGVLIGWSWSRDWQPGTVCNVTPSQLSFLGVFFSFRSFFFLFFFLLLFLEKITRFYSAVKKKKKVRNVHAHIYIYNVVDDWALKKKIIVSV